MSFRAQGVSDVDPEVGSGMDFAAVLIHSKLVSPTAMSWSNVTKNTHAMTTLKSIDIVFEEI